MNIGSGFLGQSSGRGITPQTMGQIFGAEMVGDATKSMIGTGMQSMANRSLEGLRQAGNQQAADLLFKRDVYRDEQNLLKNQLEYDRQFDKEGRRIEDLTKQRGIETEAATKQREIETNAAIKQREIETLAAERRAQTEYDRRMAEAEKANRGKMSGKVAGIKSRFDALLPLIKDAAVRERIQKSYETLTEKLNASKDPYEQEGIMSSLEGLLTPESLATLTRSFGEEKPKEDTKPPPPPAAGVAMTGKGVDELFEFNKNQATNASGTQATPSEPNALNKLWSIRNPNMSPRSEYQPMGSPSPWLTQILSGQKPKYPPTGQPSPWLKEKFNLQ